VAVTEVTQLTLRRNHSVNSSSHSSHSVNGDIAIQWEWSNLDPSQNPNLLTNYDKTMHNWLCPRDEHVTKNLCQSAVRERLAKCVKY